MMIITKEYLRSYPNHIFVFGDNLIHKGKAGAASLRDEPNTYGFITKKFPSYEDSSYFRQSEYISVLLAEYSKLERAIDEHPHKTFLISKLGAGLANKYNIWNMIRPRLFHLKRYSNVKLLWEDD